MVDPAEERFDLKAADARHGAWPRRARQLQRLGNAIVEAREIVDALGALEPVWDELYPAEQARILRLLIERIDVAPDGISVTLHAAGIRSLVAELASDNAAAGEGVVLEAAE